MKTRHPDQPVLLVKESRFGFGITRFKKNTIVEWLAMHRLNEICTLVQEGKFPREDYVQLMQLIGYSASGYCDVPLVNRRERDRARAASDAVLKSKKAKKKK